MIAKKAIFQDFRQMVRKGGSKRAMLERYLKSLNKFHLLVLLDAELDLYACLSTVVVVSVDPETGRRTRGRRQFPEAEKNSIITRCCFKVNKRSIQEFFQNEALSTAYDCVVRFIREGRPNYDEIFGYIDEIRENLSNQS
jgi:hypothetical protein